MLNRLSNVPWKPMLHLDQQHRVQRLLGEFLKKAIELHLMFSWPTSMFMIFIIKISFFIQKPTNTWIHFANRIKQRQQSMDIELKISLHHTKSALSNSTTSIAVQCPESFYYTESTPTNPTTTNYESTISNKCSVAFHNTEPICANSTTTPNNTEYMDINYPPFLSNSKSMES